jgi:hypothetical protein
VSEERYLSPADLEVGGSWRAGSARWGTRARHNAESLGELDTEELQEKEGLPDSPRRNRAYRNVARRWRFSAWLRDPTAPSESRRD